MRSASEQQPAGSGASSGLKVTMRRTSEYISSLMRNIDRRMKAETAGAA